MCRAGHPTDPETNRQGETEGNLNIDGSEFLCVLIFSLLCLAAPVNPHLRKYSFISLSLTCVKSWPCTRCPSRFRADDKCSTCGRSRRTAGSPRFRVGWRHHSHTGSITEWTGLGKTPEAIQSNPWSKSGPVPLVLWSRWSKRWRKERLRFWLIFLPLCPI